MSKRIDPSRFLFVLVLVSFLAAESAKAQVIEPGLDYFPNGDAWAPQKPLIDFSEAPIPDDFFFPGSAPFAGSFGTASGMPLQASPELSPTFPNVDTIVRRELPFQPPGAGNVTTVPIQLVGLSLQSSNPIVVTSLGSPQTQLWDVHIALSETQPSPGEMMITGGGNRGFLQGAILRLSAYLRLTFIRQSDNETKVFDFADQGRDPFQFPDECASWNGFNPDPQIPDGHFFDRNGDGNFETGPLPGTNDNFRLSAPPAPDFITDCDNNGIFDGCDLISGALQDCDMNGFPDSCEIARGTTLDFNMNGVPDACETTLSLSQLSFVTEDGAMVQQYSDYGVASVRLPEPPRDVPVWLNLRAP